MRLHSLKMFEARCRLHVLHTDAASVVHPVTMSVVVLSVTEVMMDLATIKLLVDM